MHFLARIRRHSTIDKAWRAQHRVGGTLIETQFAWDGQAFVAKQVSASNIEALRVHPSVDLEILGIAPAAAAQAPRAKPVRKAARGHQ